MGRLVKARNLATGRDDEFKIEIVAGDASRTELEIATAAEVTAVTNTTQIVTPEALAGAAIVTVAAASESVAGKVELATSAETITGTDAVRAVTPAGLAAAATTHVTAATTSAAGKVELATSPETIAVTDQTRAVTPYGLRAALALLKIVTFTGRSGAGGIAVNGVVLGDVIYAVAGLTDMGVANTFFEGAITQDDEIQQTSGSNLSAKNYIAFLYGITGVESY